MTAADYGTPGDPSIDPLTRAVELLSWALLAVGVVLVLVRYDELGAEVPIHFGAAGQPDDYGPRWSVLALLALWLVLQAGMSWLARKPQWHNTPIEVTEENRQRVHAESTRLMLWTGLPMAVLMSASVVAISGEGGISVWWMGAGLVLMLLVVVVGIWRIIRAGGPRS